MYCEVFTLSFLRPKVKVKILNNHLLLSPQNVRVLTSWLLHVTNTVHSIRKRSKTPKYSAVFTSFLRPKAKVKNWKSWIIICYYPPHNVEVFTSWFLHVLDIRELRSKVGKLTENYKENNGYYITLTFDRRSPISKGSEPERQAPISVKTVFQSVHLFSGNFVHRQRDRQTDRQTHTQTNCKEINTLHDFVEVL